MQEFAAGHAESERSDAAERAMDDDVAKDRLDVLLDELNWWRNVGVLLGCCCLLSSVVAIAATLCLLFRSK